MTAGEEDRKRKLEFVKQRLEQWKSFRQEMLPLLTSNPSARIKGRNVEYWFREACSNIISLESDVKNLEGQARNAIGLPQIPKNAMPYAAVVLIIAMLLILPVQKYTGLVAKEPSMTYADAINESYNATGEYPWTPQNQGTITSVRLSGSYAGPGNAKVYLLGSNTSYLVFDSGSHGGSMATDFNGKCTDSCAISLNEGHYFLIVELDGARIELDNISYGIASGK
jgi:hypothetical protein